MTPFDTALWIIAGIGAATAVFGLLSLRALRRAEREIENADRAGHAAE